MKKMLFLIVGILAFSCSNNDPVYEPYLNLDEPFDPGAHAISYTITQKYYDEEDENYQTDKLYFSGEKLIFFQYNDGSYSKYTYTNNLVSEIQNYDARRVMATTTKLAYDSAGRIIDFQEMPFSDKSIVAKKITFAYSADKITATVTTSPVVSTKTYEFKLDANNQIISYNDDEVFDYENGNLVAVAKSNAKITYSAIKNDNSYKKDLLGKEWKQNNFLLNLLGLKVTNRLYMFEGETSENLIASSTTILDDDSVYDMVVDYEFNSQNKLVKETRKHSETIEGETTDVERSEFIYEYK